ncbi:MAG TPA: hypothetical protein PKZ75_15225 [Bacteroidia bacterium]|nr:hypothetical protein [Bacteroidia bacterium]
MKIKILSLSFIVISFISCNKSKSNNQITNSTNNTSTSNFYKFKIGATSYNTSSLYGQDYLSPDGDTLLMINAGTNTDTINGAFTLKVKSIGTFNHDSASVSETNRFVVNFGNSSNPNSTFVSKSGTINITSFDLINHVYAGTFSAVMTLSTNPSYTLPLTNGSFYLKY